MYQYLINTRTIRICGWIKCITYNTMPLLVALSKAPAPELNVLQRINVCSAQLLLMHMTFETFCVRGELKVREMVRWRSSNLQEAPVMHHA